MSTRAAGARELAGHRMNRRLGAHVDALGGFVENQHAGIARQPLGDHDLLLIAAGEIVHGLIGPLRLDGEPVYPLARELRFARSAAPAARRERGEIRQRDVRGDRERQHGALTLPVFGHERDRRAAAARA